MKFNLYKDFKHKNNKHRKEVKTKFAYYETK